MVAKRLVILSLLALLAAIAAHGTLPDPDPGWRVARKGIGNLHSVAWGGGSYVAVGEGGEIWTSPDGLSWSDRTPDAVSRDLRAVLWDGERFVVAGLGASGVEVLTSPDGRAWTPAAAAPFASSPAAFAWNGRVHVAVGPGGQVLVSADAVEWKAQASGVTTDLRGLAWGAGTFVAVGAERTLLTSPDGVQWTSRRVPRASLDLHAITWTGARFVATCVR